MPEAVPGPIPLHDRIVALLSAHRSVMSARAVGSRADGDPTPLSDWDVEVETTDPGMLRDALPELVAPLEPLAAGWDPNGERPTYMLLLEGPAKVDIILARQRQAAVGTPHRVSVETLPQIDHHFWDWTMWLASKQLRGRDRLVTDELQRMHAQLLHPLGVAQPPTSIEQAITAYRGAYRAAAGRLALRPDGRLDAAVAPAVLRAVAGPG